MKGIYEGGLQPASMEITDHLEQVADQGGISIDDGPNPLTPKSGGMADPTSGESFSEQFVEDSNYTTAGTPLDVRAGQERVPSEVKWNGMK